MRKFAPPPQESEDAWDVYGYNPFYNPEKCGLTIVVALEEDEPYEYDTLLVVKDNETGKLFAAHDSGCRCRAPFEDFDGLDKFVAIDTEADFERLVREHQGSYRSWRPGDVLDAARKVREALA
ncbi:MAG: hypothetical protein LC118_07475 [Dehalococcoidia bacterium]|nr:hypothetical protein [Dehalococcoidia bacterium]